MAASSVLQLLEWEGRARALANQACVGEGSRSALQGQGARQSVQLGEGGGAGTERERAVMRLALDPT
jgi:hypothetical protein